nr:MAG: RNA-dependent RNA polymerase [Polycipiviridae sp.]
MNMNSQIYKPTTTKIQAGEKNTATSRKYSLVNKIRRELTRTICKGEWIHLTPKPLIQLFRDHVENNRLIVRGSPIPDFSYSIPDVLSLLRNIEIDIKEPRNARKLKDSPLFSMPVVPISPMAELNCPELDYPFARILGDQKIFLQKYQEHRDRFVETQKYDYDGNFSFDTFSTYMYLHYLSLEFLRTRSIHKLAAFLFEELQSYNYRLLDSFGVFIFLVHLKIRGVSNPTTLKRYTGWRDAWFCRTLEERQAILDAFYKGRDTNEVRAFQQSHMMEMVEFYSMLRHEARLIRYSYRVAQNYFDPEFVYLASWKAGVYDCMSSVEKYRDAANLPINYLLFGNPTMFKSLFNPTGAVQDSVSAGIKEAVQEILTDPKVKSDLSSTITESLRPTVDSLRNTADTFSDKTLNSIKNSVMPIADQMFGFFSSMNGMTDFMKSIFSQITQVFPSDLFGEKIPINMDIATIIELIKYYILYTHVDNTLIRTTLIALMLRQIGLLPYILKWGKQIFQWTFSNHSDLLQNSEGSIAEPTSSDWLTSIINLIMDFKNEIGICTIFTTLLAFIYNHVKCEGQVKSHGLRFNEFSTIAGIVTGIMKNFHWIGSGLFGLDRIFKYAMIVSQSITKWVRERVYKITDKTREQEMLVAKWIVMVRYFSTDAGRSVIRISKPAKERASRLYAEGLAFLSAYAKDNTLLTKETYSQIHRMWKDVTTISNYITRINSTSKFVPSMFHVQFVGEPGIGKSTLTEQFIEHLAKKIYPEDKQVTHWAYNPNVEHFDGYDSQDVIIIDDLFRYNEPKHLSLLIGLITNTPVPLPMAHLEDKGAHLDSDVLVSSTNVPYPIGKDIFCMEAVHRRRHILAEVKIDPRVKGNKGQFDITLFNQYYPGQNPYDFPHLKFSLMRPVRYNGEQLYETTDDGEMRVKHELIKRLRRANDCLKFEEDFYFGPDARPGPGMTVPCIDWSFNVFLENVATQYKTLRSGENKLTAKDKYSHISACFDDIDALFNPASHLPNEADVSATHRLITDQYLDMSYEYGIDDPLGERIYHNTLTPEQELEVVDFDKLVSSIVDEADAEPTNDGPIDPEKTTISYIRILQEHLTLKPSSTYLLDRIDDISNKLYHIKSLDELSDDDLLFVKQIEREVIFERERAHVVERESTRRNRILNKVNRKIEDPALKNMLTVDMSEDGYIYVPIDSHYTEWDKIVDSRTFPGERFERASFSLHHFTKMLNDYVAVDMLSENCRDALVEFVSKLYDSPRFIFPSNVVFSPSKTKHLDGVIPLEFLRRATYRKNRWYLDVTDIAFITNYSAEVEASGKTYKVPVNVAFFLSLTNAFSYICNSFSLLTTTQQEYAASESQWQYQFLRRLNMNSLKEDLRILIRSVKRTIMPYIFYPLQLVWKTIKFVVPMVIAVIVVYAQINMLRQFASLFVSKQPTSKFLHKPHIEGLRYHGRPTSSAFCPRETDQHLAQSYLQRNVKFFTITNQFGGEIRAHGIHTQQFLILNAHTAREIREPVEISYNPTGNSNHAWTIQVSPEQVYCKPNTDVAIIFSRLLPMARDLTAHFITQHDFDTVENVGELWALTKFDQQELVEIRDNCRPTKNLTLTGESGECGKFDNAIIVEGSTICGKSGSMLIKPNTKSGHRHIIGIQAWRIKDYYRQTICYQVITQECLKEMINVVSKQTTIPIISQAGPLVCEPTASQNAEIFKSHVDLIGSVPKDKIVGMVGKSAFKRTPIANLMDSEGFTSPRVPAALKPNDRRLLVKEHPMLHSINKYGKGAVGPFDMELIEKATHDLGFWLKNKLDQNKFRTDLTLEECVEGLRIPGSNPVDCRASAGLPHNWDKFPGKLPGKKSYVEIGEDGVCVVKSDEFRTQFENTFKALSSGHIPKHTSYDFPKDELRPYYKALGNPTEDTPPKTRTVTCMNMEFIFSWRRVTLDLFSSLHRAARGDFPFGPGINPEGPDWTNLYHYLNKHPHVLDFDVSNWDGHMPPDLLYAAGDILCILLNIKQNSPQAKVIYSLLTEVLFGHVQFEDAVYQKFRGLISGFPGTAEMNTLVHLLLMYYFYLYICSMFHKFSYANIAEFFRLVSPVFYGDDVIMSISDEIIEWFNGKEIARMYTEHGYPVTTASKSGDIPFSKTINECQFLKSGFNYIHSCRVDRAMDIDVVYDLFYWVRAGEHPYDQFRSNLHDAFRILHGRGKTEYDSVLSQVNSWLRVRNLEPFCLRWEDFESNHIKNYYS